MAPSVLRFGRCLRPWQVGRREAGPLPAPSSAGLKIQQQAFSIREALFTRTMTSSLPVSILCSISAHHSCLLILLLSPFVVASPLSSSSPSCSEVLPPLCSCQARKAWRLDVKNCPKFDFRMDEQLMAPLLSGSSMSFCLYFSFKSSLQPYLSICWLCSPPSSLFASQAVWHPAPSLWRERVEADNYTSCPVSALQCWTVIPTFVAFLLKLRNHSFLSRLCDLYLHLHIISDRNHHFCSSLKYRYKAHYTVHCTLYKKNGSS